MAVAQSETLVPAWKRLGLKLKNGNSNGSEIPSIAAEENKKKNLNTPRGKKRKASEDISASPKECAVTPKPVSNAKSATSTSSAASAKRRKSVQFADGSKEADGDANSKLLEVFVAGQRGGDGEFTQREIQQFTTSKKDSAKQSSNEDQSKDLKTPAKKVKKQKSRAKQETTAVTTTQLTTQQVTTYAEYLKTYHEDRSRWKFNKSQQTKILANLFNIFHIPGELDDALTSYLSGLQSEATRKRVQAEAEKVVLETADLDGVETMKFSDSPHDAALKAHLKQAKSLMRNEQAHEQASSAEHGLRLQKRKRATMLLRELDAKCPTNHQGEPAQALSEGEGGVRAKKRKRARVRKDKRTGVPDDDETDETSSVSSVASSVVSSSSSSEDDEKDSDGDSSDDSSDNDGSDDGSVDGDSGKSGIASSQQDRSEAK